MGSPQDVLTFGFGSWGSIADVVTLGFGSAEPVISLPDPYRHRSFATSDDRMRAPTPATDDRLRTTLGSDDRLRESSRAVV